MYYFDLLCLTGSLLHATFFLRSGKAPRQIQGSFLYYWAIFQINDISETKSQMPGLEYLSMLALGPGQYFTLPSVLIPAAVSATCQENLLITVTTQSTLPTSLDTSQWDL